MKIEKIGGLWFANDVLITDPVCAAFEAKMKDPEFVGRLFEECLARNPFMQRITETSEKS